MATGYYYNLTLVQFGLLDLGTRVIGMNEQRVAADMAVLALITSVVAITFGLLMMKTGWQCTSGHTGIYDPDRFDLHHSFCWVMGRLTGCHDRPWSCHADPFWFAGVRPSGRSPI